MLRLPGAAQAAVDSNFDFGAVAVGASTQLALTAENVGTDPLTVTGVGVEGADTGSYFVRGPTGLLAPGATLAVTVTFTPVRAGAQDARLVLHHDADAPAATCSLSGAGQ